MSALDLLSDIAKDRALTSELAAWRLWAAKRLCDCEAYAQLGSQPTLAEIDLHRDGCRYKIVATDLGETE